MRVQLPDEILLSGLVQPGFWIDVPDEEEQQQINFLNSYINYSDAGIAYRPQVAASTLLLGSSGAGAVVTPEKKTELLMILGLLAWPAAGLLVLYCVSRK